jgi:RNA polymerase sigma factor (sigma-70 family)
MRTNPTAETLNDARLVELSRTGDRDAFGRIVERYQSLVCALTYSASGNLQASEDLAQVTFITAWCQLGNLREPAKLESWLCRIARNVTVDSFRQQQRTPTAHAKVLDATTDISTDTATPRDHVISKEEEAILWRSLSELPPTYREPLVLFYRRQQSVAEVADALELSEDAVKQRLSRGRAMLAEQVTVFIEGALRQTTPGKAFTLGVLAALPMLTTSAKAAVVGATATKGSVTAKAAAATGLFGAILGPIVGILGGWLGTEACIAGAESSRERQFMVKAMRITWALAGLFCLVVFLLTFTMRHSQNTHPLLITTALIAAGLAYVIGLFVVILWMNRTQRRIRREEARKESLGTSPQTRPVIFQPFEYRSRWALLGLPLIHVAMACKKDGKDVPARGWIAVGGWAYGALFAFGGIAVGPISMGGCCLGLVAIGGCGVGLLAFAGVALGLWAVGGAALGYLAFGGGAMGWLAANGGSAVAHDFAVGGAAFAHHANDEVARSFVRNNVFFTHASAWLKSATWLMWLPVLCQIMPNMLRAARDRRQKHA